VENLSKRVKVLLEAILVYCTSTFLIPSQMMKIFLGDDQVVTGREE